MGNNASLLENHISLLLEKAEENTSSTEYLAAITLYRTVIRLLQQKEYLLNSANFLDELKIITNSAINQTTEEMNDVFKTIEQNAAIINIQIKDLEKAKNIENISFSVSRISNSIDILLNLREKGFHIPNNDYNYFFEQVKIKANDQILAVIKDKFDCFKIESANSTSEKFITDSATALLNEVEKAHKILTDASNHNFTQISLKQLGEKIQDAYSESVSQIN